MWQIPYSSLDKTRRRLFVG